MNSTEFRSICHQVKENIRWVDAKGRKDIAKHLERKYGFKFVDSETLSKQIDKLKAFDINLLWDKSFWGLSQSDSISAVASEPYGFIKRLQSNELNIQ
jgi:hypothetical protein